MFSCGDYWKECFLEGGAYVDLRARQLLFKKCPYLKFFCPVFSRIGLNKERYGVSLRIHSEPGKYGLAKLRIQTLFTQ